MNRIEKIIGLSIIGLSAIFALFYILLAVAGKYIIAGQIENLTHKKTSVEFFGFAPGFQLEIRKLNIENSFKADAIYVSPNLLNLFSGRIVLNDLKLVRPELTYIKTPPVVVEGVKPNGEIIPSLPAQPVNQEVAQDNVNFPLLAFKRIKLRDGKINYIDQSMTNKSIKITIKDINCSISNLYFYPHNSVTSFNLSGRIPWRDGEAEGKFATSGWVNYHKKDMQAQIKINDIDAIYLYPYYSTWVDLDKARIEKAKLNLSADIKGANNDISVACHMELADMVRKPLEAGAQEEKASIITNRVLDMFKTMDQGKVELNFTIKTRMDSPQFGFENFKAAFESKLMQGRQAQGFRPTDILAFPVRLMENGAKVFNDLGKALTDGLHAIGNEVGVSTQQVLKKINPALK